MIKGDPMKNNLTNIMVLVFLTGLLLLTGCTTVKTAKTAETQSEDRSWMFHDIVDAEFVKAHMDIPMPANVMLIDSRPYKTKFIQGHIPGAVSIPFSEFDQKIKLLPQDKNALLIYYCEGETCKLSHNSARKAEALGYKNVKVYAKGYPEWVTLKGNYPSVSAEQVALMISENRALIVDSRPKQAKYDKGHIPTAVNIPLTQFDELKGKLPRDTKTPVVFYCGGLDCPLSHKSAKKAIEMGYTDVAVFSLGYPEWEKLYGGSAPAVAAKSGGVEGAIDLDRFAGILANNPESIMIVDVRDPDEFAKGSFKTAVNIPVEHLEKKINDLPEDKPVVFVCTTGARSGEAFYMAKDLRSSLKEVYYVEAGITFKGDGQYEIKKPKKPGSEK
ncbi:MAG: sulfurtransferase [Desulfobacula sp. RIFOXYA12_FULL_46_16]|nr:MAG: sulfurtransferase [Desulfobacula sp. RIFOXYA12_FULL_46_16]